MAEPGHQCERAVEPDAWELLPRPRCCIAPPDCCIQAILQHYHDVQQLCKNAACLPHQLYKNGQAQMDADRMNIPVCILCCAARRVTNM